MTSPLFDEALRRIDAANAVDPRSVTVEGVRRPEELVYAERMSAWLARLRPEASEELQLAVRCQHLCRWTIRREEYPEGRAGYRQWRTTLGGFHAEKAAEILTSVGYPPESVERVGSLIRKERLTLDDEAQTLEDTACLVFLEFYFADFAPQHDEAKVIDIVRKTWRKMSPQAHAAALRLPLSDAALRLVGLALAPAE